MELWADPAPWWSSSSHDAGSHMELQTEDIFIFLPFPNYRSSRCHRLTKLLADGILFQACAGLQSWHWRPLTLVGLTRGGAEVEPEHLIDWLIDHGTWAHSQSVRARIQVDVDQMRISLSDMQIHLALLYNLLFCVSGEFSVWEIVHVHKFNRESNHYFPCKLSFILFNKTKCIFWSFAY